MTLFYGLRKVESFLACGVGPGYYIEYNCFEKLDLIGVSPHTPLHSLPSLQRTKQEKSRQNESPRSLPQGRNF
jgi:hypothetical protein